MFRFASCGWLVALMISTTVCFGQDATETNTDTDNQSESTESLTPVENLEDLDWRLGTWIGEEQPLDQAIPGFAKKGDLTRLHVTIENRLNDRFQFDTGVVHREGKQFTAFQSIWGPRPESTTINFWQFSADGPLFPGEVFRNGNKVIIVMIEGSMLASKAQGPIQPIVEKLGVEKFEYSGEMHFRNIDENTMGVSVHKPQIGGLPVPWPNVGEETIMHRSE